MQSLILIGRRVWSGRIASLQLFRVSFFLSSFLPIFFSCFLRLAYKSCRRMNRHRYTLSRRVLRQGRAFWGLECLFFTFLPIFTENGQNKPEIGNVMPFMPITGRIEFKLCVLVYKSLNGIAQPYIDDMIQPVSTLQRQVTLRSATTNDFVGTSCSTAIRRARLQHCRTASMEYGTVYRPKLETLLRYTGADREISFGGPRGAEGAEVERRRREDRGAAGAEGSGVWGGGVPLPTGEGSGEGAARKFFQYCIIKWPVLVDSDVLHVLLIVVTDR